jgi:hypothetical protein
LSLVAHSLYKTSDALDLISEVTKVDATFVHQKNRLMLKSVASDEEATLLAPSPPPPQSQRYGELSAGEKRTDLETISKNVPELCFSWSFLPLGRDSFAPTHHRPGTCILCDVPGGDGNGRSNRGNKGKQVDSFSFENKTDGNERQRAGSRRSVPLGLYAGISLELREQLSGPSSENIM